MVAPRPFAAIPTTGLLGLGGTGNSNQFFGNALQGIGAGLLSYAANRNIGQAGLLGAQAMQQAQADQEAKQWRDLQTQSLTQQMARQQQEAQRQAKQDEIAQKQQDRLNALIASLPADKQPLALMAPDAFAKASIEQAFAPPKAPTTVGGMQYDPEQRRFVPIPGYTEQQAAIASAGRAPTASSDQWVSYTDTKTGRTGQKNLKTGKVDWDPAGQTQMVQTGTDAQGQPIYSFVPVAGKVTEDQAKNNQLYQRTSEQLPIVMKNFDALASLTDQAAGKVPLLGNYMQDASYQQANNALKDIVASYLYSVSGATANPGEVANLVATVTPMPGESKESKADKKARIQQMVESIKQRTSQAQSNLQNTVNPGTPPSPTPPGAKANEKSPKDMTDDELLKALGGQ